MKAVVGTTADEGVEAGIWPARPSAGVPTRTRLARVTGGGGLG